MNNQRLLTSYNEFLVVREYSKPENRTEREKRLLFLVDEVLDLTTYCEEYSLEIGEQVLEIIIFIYKKHNSNDHSVESIVNYRKENNGYTYILYTQFIIQYLEWGTSIWSAWFDSSKEIEGMKLTSENVVKLINWLDCTNE